MQFLEALALCASHDRTGVGLAPHRGDLDIALTVFGFSAEWMPAAAEALTAALVHRVDWAGPRRLFVPRRRAPARRLECIDGLVLPGFAPARVLIETLSPPGVQSHNVVACHCRR